MFMINRQTDPIQTPAQKSKDRLLISPSCFPPLAILIF